MYDPEASAGQKNAVKHTLFEMMGVIVRLLHPMMPFLSEEIWSRLPGSRGFVAAARYPSADEYRTDEGVIEEVALLQDTLTEIRRIRGEMEIALKVPLEVRVAEMSLYGLLSEHSRAVWDAARCTVLLSTQEPAFAATGVVAGHRLVIPLEGVVDRQAEVARLDKELAKVSKDVDGLEKRLSNPDFAARAKPEVVADFRDKLDSAKRRQDALSAARNRLGGA
jgi:valyl-tRNA synthetase